MLRRAHVLFLFCAALLAGALLACSFGLAELSASEQAAAERNLAIVVNQSNPVNELTMAELRRVFLGERGHWPNGRRITLVMLEPGWPERAAVLTSIYHMDEAEFNNHFLHGLFTGEVFVSPRRCQRRKWFGSSYLTCPAQSAISAPPTWIRPSKSSTSTNVFPVIKAISCTFPHGRANSVGREKAGRKREAMPGTSTGPAQTWGRFSRYSSALLFFFTFCAVVVVGLFVIRDLRRADKDEQNMFTGSVLILHRIAALEYQTQETRRSTLYALGTADSNLHVKYADQSREADHLVSEGIAAYLANARTRNELDIGSRLRRDWSTYLSVRDEVLASILEGSAKEAVDRDLTEGVASFDRVRQDLAEIELIYDQQAAQQLSNVDATSRRTILRVAGVLAITLVATIASVWTIQRMRMTGAIQLAKLQMEFVASVSHELRTPLAVISSAADNIADGLVREKDDLRKYGAAIQTQSRQMMELVDQILLFSATKDRAGHAAFRTLDVARIVD